MLKIPESAYISDSAMISGEVSMGEDCSVFFNASIRGDAGGIVLGARCNVQDNSVLHGKVCVGNEVTIGHSAIVHGCTVGNNVLIGMGAIVMDGAVIGDNCVIGAGTLITSGKVIPPNSLVYGRPAEIIRTLSAEEAKTYLRGAAHYVELGRSYKKGEIEIYKR